MELTAMNLIVVTLLCALTAYLAHKGKAVFHDGIRPVIPEYLEGRMSRPQMATIAFGLSVGFIASVGIGNSLATNLLNPWLLFLSTDIIGIVAPTAWLAPILGGAWGVLCLTAIGGVNTVLTGLPVDLIAGMGDVGSFVVTGFALFPILAIVMQFGLKKGVIAGSASLLMSLIGPKFSTISADSWTMLTGMIILVVFITMKDMELKKASKAEEKDTAYTENVFTERVQRIRKNLPWLMAVGAVIAIASNLRIFAGSMVSMFDLSTAYGMSDAAEASALIKTAATNELMRGLSFIPLIATTAVTTGVYGVAGFTFVYVAGYLSGNVWLAGILGAVIIFIEVMFLGLIGRFLGSFPSMRDASDNIRSAMTRCVEFALLIGSSIACINMGRSVGSAGLGFFLAAIVYMVNEMTGRKIMRMAVGPIAAIVTGVILNIFYVLGLVQLVG